VPSLTIVIPNWNGADLMRLYLPSVVTEVERWRGAHTSDAEIVVSDDGSSDDSLRLLREHFPQVRVIASQVNRGFGPAVNAGVGAARGELIVLLNSDVALTSGALDPLPRWFGDASLFGVTLRGLDLPGLTFSTGGKLGRFRHGFWETWRNYDVAPALSKPPDAAALPSFALVGGFCAFRRSGFLELGGFDERLAPYYWEDIDLSYRVRKRGWSIGYEPRSVVHHAVSASVSRHAGRFRRDVMIHRNRLLFHWKNLDRERLIVHLAWAHLLLVQLAFKRDFAYHCGYRAALKQLGFVLGFRRAERAHWGRRDRDLELAAPPGINAS
jgi:GT2 family glycosyltransferase